MPAQRQRVVLDAEVERPRSGRGRGRRPAGRRRSGPAAGVPRSEHLLPALGDRLELAVAVELVAEQVGEQDRARVQLRRERRRATARRPRTARARRRSLAAARAAASRVVAIPPAMFAPAWLCTSGTPACSKMPAAIAAVVVLPLVAEMSTLPCRSARAEVPIASGCQAHQHLARGARAPPPRSRESAPTVRASASLGASALAISAPAEARSEEVGDAGRSGRRAGGASGGGPAKRRPLGPRGTSTRTAPGTARTRTGSSPIGSPSAYIVNGRDRQLIATSRARNTRTLGSCTCVPLKTFGRIRQESELADVSRSRPRRAGRRRAARRGPRACRRRRPSSWRPPRCSR